MTLSRIIKLRTDSGGSIVDFLIDVMQDRYKDFRICHRLQAARLLTTYGNEDAPNFIADNPSDSSPRRDRPDSPRQTRFDTELARVIQEDTGDGRSIARFLVNVMVGELTSFKPHHRMAAARELLDRGFGKSSRTERTVRPEPVEGPAHTGPERGRPARTEPIETPGPSTDDNNKITVIPESHESQFRQSTDLLDTLHRLPPDQFEHTVLDLLENMGYGHARNLERTGDGDIDGIIDQDALGLNRLYMQAKRWTDPVGAPEITNFSGNLEPNGANKGILITTSDFTYTAQRTAAAISIGNKDIRLVNGHELAHLILTHNIRVTPDIRVTSDTPQHSRRPDKNHHIHHT